MASKHVSVDWGEPSEKMVLNGASFLVRPNLAFFLADFAASTKEEKPGRLWIDAIAINQQSNEERNHQVQMIRHIYTRAEEVLIWARPS